MRRGRTGEYNSKRIGGERVNAFIPHPLPPEPAPEVTGPRARQHEQAFPLTMWWRSRTTSLQ